jgi:hypothetical protein
MAEIKNLSQKIDQTVGTQLYTAYQDIDAEELFVEQLDTSLAIVGSAESFGAATETEIDNGTYKLAVYTASDPPTASNEDYVIAYGRTNK